VQARVSYHSGGESEKTLLSSECKPPQVAQSTRENGFEMEDREEPVTSQNSVEVVLCKKASIDDVIIGMLQSVSHSGSNIDHLGHMYVCMYVIVLERSNVPNANVISFQITSGHDFSRFVLGATVTPVL
jgi:hypothetical protein